MIIMKGFSLITPPGRVSNINEHKGSINYKTSKIYIYDMIKESPGLYDIKAPKKFAHLTEVTNLPRFRVTESELIFITYEFSCIINFRVVKCKNCFLFLKSNK